MPLIPHKFQADGHRYYVRGEYCLSTSDVIQLNGLSLLQGVPPETLAWASARGQMVHSAIEAFELDLEPVKLTEEANVRFDAYHRWKQQVNFYLIAPMERSLVYRHEGTEALIGGTPDAVGVVDGKVYVVDFKTCFRQSGKAKAQKLLEWRMQTQSYYEALQEDEYLWKRVKSMGRAVLHLHPDCGVVTRGVARLGYEWHPFTQDDSLLWDSCIRVAQAKLAAGHSLPDKHTENIFKPKTDALPETDCIF